MTYQKIVCYTIALFISISISAQKSAIYTHHLTDYNHALELYQNNAFVAAQEKFNEIKFSFENSSELRANCEFYAANCAVRLGQPNADDLMQQFVDNYPTSTKRNSAFLDVANYYFDSGKYAYATKWYAKSNTTNLTYQEEETFNFKYGYALFATKNYSSAKNYFLQLLNSQTYGAQAKYYYGYIAYDQDDYTTADRYLGEVAEDKSYKTNVSYYLADMNFKLGNFDKAIEYGAPLLEKSRGIEHSEISKILGESYFNLEKYNQAIFHLKNYKGKAGKWTNTDYYLLGYAYYKQNDYENAIGNFNKIINGTNAVAQNAYYHLAECYLKLNQKTEALNAFRNASQMNFSAEIQRDAWLNYAKLSYDIGNPYKSVPEVLKEYMELYPNSPETTNINDLIISSYMLSNDFKGAIKYVANKKGTKERITLQKAAFYHGIELFNEGNFFEAKESFISSLSSPINDILKARAIFWKAEANYRLNNFSEAVSDFNSFTSNSVATKTSEFKQVYYNLGYAYFKLKDYNNSIASFKKYIDSYNADLTKKNDSYLRIADSYFANSNYNNAITYYDKVVNLNEGETDYAMFQKAISYGLTGNENAKIKALQTFINTQLKSAYRDDAYFVLGNSYLERNESRLALENFDLLINNYNKSPLVSKAMLKKGLTLYNESKNQQALTVFKTVVTKFPSTPEAHQAVKNARQIYLDLGQVDEYAAWVKNLDFINISNSDLDNDMYESAEKQYLQNNHSKAIAGFKKYLENFEKGIHANQANFYLAQSLFSEKKYQEAIPYFNFVVQQNQNEFTENALARLSLLYLESNNWGLAIPILKRLETESGSQQNITYAQSNLMKGYYQKENFIQAVSYANLVLKNSKIEDKIKADAHLIIARSALKTKDNTVARNAYSEVEKIASGEIKAEALYYKAFFENKDGSYRVSNEIIQKIASEYAAYKYWAAKGLVLMANNYNQLKDAYQATYILESVIKNFSQFEDVVTKAKESLKKVKTEQSKTNESLIIEN